MATETFRIGDQGQIQWSKTPGQTEGAACVKIVLRCVETR
jgi:hypothetical protein